MTTDRKRYTIRRADGRRVQASVPQNDVSELFDAIREQLSPQAVASIVAHLGGATTNNPSVDGEVRWFASELTDLLGGPQAQGALMAELGL